MLFRHFKDAEDECRAILKKGAEGNRQTMAVPAYEQVVKASHNFNLLDARGVISVQERQSYILRIRELAKECGALLAQNLALPAYDQCIKASHNFNLLDARGVISVTERQAYIGRVRALAKGCAEAWLKSEGGAGA
jgi:glycyl-tRNA synthetase alpha subunit